MHFFAFPKGLLLCLAGLLPSLAFADFINDSHLRLDTRNFYLNRDYRDADLSDTPRHDGKSQAKAEEWTQGFLLRFKSGYTEGPVGFGLDALGLAGLKLDSGAGTSGTGALRRNPQNGKPADEFSFLGLTAKARISQTVLSVGDHEPVLPVAVRQDTRLLPQTFQGAQVLSKDIDKLMLIGGQFDAVHQRDSGNYDDLSMSADGSHGGVTTDRFGYAGATYTPLTNLELTAYHAELKDNYSQSIANLVYTLPLGSTAKLKADLRYFDSNGEDRSDVDNRLQGGMFSYLNQGHRLSLAYQDQSGRTGIPYLAGTDVWGFNNGTYHNFARADADSWQLRYDYDFAAAGLPGLTLMARYISADGFRVSGQAARAWERDIDLGYVIQSGTLKGLGLLWRNATFRSNALTDIDDNRVLIAYTFNFW
jgi:hypothetical protein